jgi:hypothetical protein
LASDLMILLDGNEQAVKNALVGVSWVADVISERGEKEIDDIVDSARRLLKKRESENLNYPQPSKEMRQAIEWVTGSKYATLLSQARAETTGQAAAANENILHVLQRIGRGLKKLAPHYPMLARLFFRLKLK